MLHSQPLSVEVHSRWDRANGKNDMIDGLDCETRSHGGCVQQCNASQTPMGVMALKVVGNGKGSESSFLHFRASLAGLPQEA